MLFLSIKALHIIFVTSWFAGLFYLPRLFVNHAMVTDKATIERLELMEHKLYRFMTPLGILAVALGMWLWFGYGFTGGWLFAGGFMGHLAKTGDISFENMKRGIIVGSAMASFCVEKFGPTKLKEITKKDIDIRMQQFKDLVSFEIELV